MASLQKNVASQNFSFCMVNASTGAADASATVTVKVVKDNGAQATGAGTVTNVGLGQYNYAPTQSETNATDIGFLLTATGDIPVNIDFHTDLTDAGGNLQVDVTKINSVSTASVTTINANQGTVQPINFTGTGGSALVQDDVRDWNGTAVSAPVTAGIPDVNAKNINNVSTSSVTTINANQGTTQPINFTGTAGSALAQSDVKDWNSVAVGNLPANFSVLSIDSNGNIFSTSNVKKNVASAGLMFVMTDSSTHQPKTGLTVTSQRSIDGAVFSGATNAAVEVAFGVYSLSLSAADVNGNHIIFLFTATGADNRYVEIITQP